MYLAVAIKSVSMTDQFSGCQSSEGKRYLLVVCLLGAYDAYTIHIPVQVTKATYQYWLVQ